MNRTGNIRLVGDVGGTNARLAWVDEKDQLQDIRNFSCQDYTGLDEIYRSYCQQMAIHPTAVCFAVAGPVGPDEVRISNLDWCFSIQGLQRLLDVPKLHIVNDFAALARALPLLPDRSLRLLLAADGEHYGTRAVIGPGTGLGTAAIVWYGGGWQVIAAEGGHMTLPIRTDREVEVWRLMRRHYKRISAERVLCGPGIVELYRSVCELENIVPRFSTAAEVVDAGQHHQDDQAVESLYMFCALLGDVAGNFALCVGATGGVYLGGGILPRIISFLQASEFTERFRNRGRADEFIRRMPVFVICEPYPALPGCVAYLSQTS